ncbi:MAG: peptide chain release factor N(5)-glutamine methyltransferase [Parachlamydiaceae bacterium]|nr:peptide chain release factor N(5)-glutamine methyltransferase [Parachlamydiaceae bacterium]
MKTVLEIVNLSAEFLENKGIKHGRREALDLISFSLDVRPLDLYVQFDRPLDEKELERCRSLLKRRAVGEPIQYIRGKVEFFNCTIKLSRDVLIPRQETEILVDQIATRLAKEELSGKLLVDLCCGSGCIGIALKRRFPDLEVVSTDLSPEAVAIAQANATLNSVEINFVVGDFLQPLAGKRIDYLVCNPPYIAEEEFSQLEIEVRNFEPKMALVGEDKGLAFYKRLAKELPEVMSAGGKVWLELGHEQGKEVLDIFKDCPAKKMEILQDWSGHDRFFFLELE